MIETHTVLLNNYHCFDLLSESVREWVMAQKTKQNLYW